MRRIVVVSFFSETIAVHVIELRRSKSKPSLIVMLVADSSVRSNAYYGRNCFFAKREELHICRLACISLNLDRPLTFSGRRF